jgi:predicted esterase
LCFARRRFSDVGKLRSREYGIKKEVHTYLVGYSSGATLVYAAMFKLSPPFFLPHLALGSVLIFPPRKASVKKEV